MSVNTQYRNISATLEQPCWFFVLLILKYVYITYNNNLNTNNNYYYF